MHFNSILTSILKKRILLIVLAITLVFITIIISYSNSAPVRVNKKLELAKKYLTELNYEQAIVTYKQILNMYDDNYEAYIGLSEVYCECRDYESAIETLKLGQEKTKYNDISNVMLKTYMSAGKYFSDKQNYLTAIKWLEEAYTQYSDNVELIIDLAQVYKENGEIEKAIQLLRNSMKNHDSKEMKHLYDTYVKLASSQPWFQQPLFTTDSLLINGKNIEELSIEKLLDEWDLVIYRKHVDTVDGHIICDCIQRDYIINAVNDTYKDPDGEFYDETYYNTRIGDPFYVSIYNGNSISLVQFTNDGVEHEHESIHYDNSENRDITSLTLQSGDKIQPASWYSMENSVCQFGDTYEQIVDAFPQEYHELLKKIEIEDYKDYYYGNDNIYGQIHRCYDANHDGSFLELNEEKQYMRFHFTKEGLLDDVLFLY